MEVNANFLQWFDEEEAFGWQKKALTEARNEIRENFEHRSGRILLIGLSLIYYELTSLTNFKIN